MSYLSLVVVTAAALLAVFDTSPAAATRWDGHGRWGTTTTTAPSTTVAPTTTAAPTTTTAPTTTAPTTTAPTTTTAPITTSVPAGTYPVPASIPADCSVDVTQQLVAWIASVPDGASASSPSILSFPAGACYRLEGLITLFSRHNLDLEGNGAQFVAYTDGSQAQMPSQQGLEGLLVNWPRLRGQFYVDSSSYITMRGLVARGIDSTCANSTTYTAANVNEQDAFSVDGSDHVLLDGDSSYNTYGDMVDVLFGSTNVTVQNGHYDCTGREGMQVGWGQQVTFDNNLVTRAWGASFSLEPMATTWLINNVNITNNDVGTSTWGMFVSNQGAGGGATVHDINISGNRLHGAEIDIRVTRTDTPAPGDINRYNYTIANNTSDILDPNYTIALAWMTGVDNVTVSGNDQPWYVYPVGGAVTVAVRIEGCNGVQVLNNTLTSVDQVLVADSTSTNYSAQGNIV